MATTNATATLFPSALYYWATGQIDLDNDQIRILILNSSWTPAPTTEYRLSDISANEISGNGYSRHLLANVSVSPSPSDSPLNWTSPVTVDFDNPQFTASGGDIVGRRWAAFDDTHANDVLIGYGLLNSADADVTTTDGNTLTLNLNSLGWLRFAAS